MPSLTPGRGWVTDGKALDDGVALGQRSATFELEFPALLLQTPQAVHQPVIFLDQVGIDVERLCKLIHQLGKNRQLVQKLQRAGHLFVRHHRGSDTRRLAGLRCLLRQPAADPPLGGD